MKRNFVISTSLVLVMALIMFVQPVQTLALDLLSKFRVSNVETIEITMGDLQEGMQIISSLKENFNGEEAGHKSLIDIVSKSKHEVIQLTDAEEFDAFELRLPRELKSEQPEISAIKYGTTTFTIDVDASNEFLQMVNSPKQLSDNLKNVELAMVSSDTAYAKYDELLFFATQKSYLDAPEAVKNELHEIMINLPIIPTNIRLQLAEIEQGNSDIHLPVLVGFGRQVDLGGKNGYIYTVADFKALKETMSQTMVAPESHNRSIESFTGESHEAAMDELKAKFISKHGEQELDAMIEAHETAMKDMPNLDNASVLIWTEDGNLYGLIGNKTDTELAKIARSVR